MRILLLLTMIIGSFLAGSSSLLAADPAVKIHIEVVVFDDGKVDVKQKRQKASSKKKKVRKCDCPISDCKACRSESGKCKDCPLCWSSIKPEKQGRGRMQGKKPMQTKKIVASGTASKIMKSIMALDKNSDGRLNADEASSRLRSPFSAVDKNGDGYLDSGEVLRQVKNKMRKTGS